MRVFAQIGAFFGFTGVALGAFGAHALRDKLPADMLAIYQTGVQYQVLHALALLVIGFALTDSRSFRVAGWLFAFGILVFSGSLYALSLTGTRALGAITPLGGVALLAGWACLFFAATKGRR